GRESSWGAFAQLFGGPWYGPVGGLDASGEKVFDGDFWAWLAEHPRERALFDRAMEQGQERRMDRLAGIEWNGGTVVPVGGGNGAFRPELFARQPGRRGIVSDLPETGRNDARLAAAGIEFVEGSFFDRVPEGDVYVLGTILHDWSNDRAAAILTTIRECAPSGARVLILDSVVQAGNEPQGSKWLDLLMLAMPGGRGPTQPEWRELLDGAGLRLDAIEDGLVQASCP